MGRTNPHDVEGCEDLIYRPTQCSEHFIPYLNFEPEWFIDCGPASGMETPCMCAKYPLIHVLGLEPSAAGYRRALPRFDGADKRRKLLNVAVWNCDEPVKIYYPDDLLHSNCFAGTQRALDNDTSDNPADPSSLDWTTVPGRSLDSLDAEFGPFKNAALWMDIEGAELRALDGAKNLLSRRAIRAINMETRPLEQTYIQIQRILKEAGYHYERCYLASPSYRDEVWLTK